MPLYARLRKTSLVDFPGLVSTVFFFPGCNLRCPWCHNRELVAGGAEGLAGIEEALAHARKRRAVLGGVVLSGGEPCLIAELPGMIAEIKKTGLRVKLDTNGTFPLMLETLFRREETRPDYIALDLKIAPRRYAELLSPAAGKKGARRREEAGNRPPAEAAAPPEAPGPGENLVQSAALIRRSGIPHEYRSLALPAGFMDENDIEALAPLADGAPWHFRPFRGGNCLDPAWNGLEEPASEAAARLRTLAEKAVELGKNGLPRP